MADFIKEKIIKTRVKQMKILNLYAGIGGNRSLWTNANITAVEIDKDIAAVYKKRFPEDTVIVGDSIKFLENNYNKFDFIWASPPCQSHGQYRHNVGVIGKGFSPIIPDMSLYAIIVFLENYYKGKYVIENTIPYYKYLIEPNIILQRHPIWANFKINKKIFNNDNIRTKNKLSDFEEYKYLINSDIKNKRQVLRNCVNKDLGNYIFNEFLKQNVERR